MTNNNNDQRPFMISRENYKNCVLHDFDKQFLKDLEQVRSEYNVDAIFTIDEFSGKIIHLKTHDELINWANRGKQYYDQCELTVKKIMGLHMAKQVHDMRITQRFSWRLLADSCWHLWKIKPLWLPPTNQMAGMALCKVASDILKIDFY
jgi:hypothetical protein